MRDTPKDEKVLEHAMQAAGYNVKTVDVTDWKALYADIRQQTAALRQAILEHIVEMDNLMKGPSTYERGRKIAASISALQRACEANTIREKP